MRLIDEGDETPFSKGLMAQTLMATGLAPERAYGVAAAVERRLRRRGPAALTLADLHEIAREQLGDLEGDILIQRFRQWQTLRRLETPLIVLIGGATGVGKSTLATELAHRLGITRVISTDMVRQTMRAFFAPELMPAIHTSSFDAASAVRVPVPRETDLSKVGFMEQTKAVSVGIEAIVARGIDEAQRMVIEGVHLVPGLPRPLALARGPGARVRARRERQGPSPRQLHGARVGDRRHPAAAPLRRAFRPDPPHPEVHRRPGHGAGRARWSTTPASTRT